MDYQRKEEDLTGYMGRITPHDPGKNEFLPRRQLPVDEAYRTYKREEKPTKPHCGQGFTRT